jgi:hypothetical protein
MKRTLLCLATVGLLLNAGPALSQNTETKTQTPAGNTTTQTQSGQTGERSSTQSRERRDGERSERRGDRDGARSRERSERTSVNVRIRGDRDGYRYRRHHRHGVGLYIGGCRTIIVKKWRHGHRVIKRIRRCG